MPIRLLSIVVFLILISGCAQPEGGMDTAPAAAPRLTAGWSLTEGMDTPESAYWDPVSGFIYVSQVAGSPTERDGRGRIAKLGPDGTLVDAAWVTGLNAPKGLRSHDGVLWTADIDQVIGIDIASGSVIARIEAPDAQFLNDVATAPDGTVYVSDMMLSRIYAVTDGQISIFAEGDDLEHPNGLLVENGRLVVASWGKPGPDFSTEVPGRLYTLDLATKEKTLITPEPVGNLDGVESDGRGGYIVTDWIAGTALQIRAGGDAHLIRQFGAGTADHAFAPDEGVLIIPHMTENRVAAYDISELLQ